MEMVLKKEGFKQEERNGKKLLYIKDIEGNFYWCHDEKLFPEIMREKVLMVEVQESVTDKGIKREIVKITGHEDLRVKLDRIKGDRIEKYTMSKEEGINRSVSLQEAVSLVSPLIALGKDPLADRQSIMNWARITIDVFTEIRKSVFGGSDVVFTTETLPSDNQVIDPTPKQSSQTVPTTPKQESPKPDPVKPEVKSEIPKSEIPPVKSTVIEEPVVPHKGSNPTSEQNKPGSGSSTDFCKCQNCGKPVKDNVRAFSERHYGKGIILCMSCQEKKKKK